MKEVYITYDRYGCDEWYSVYYLGVNEEKAIQDFKEKSLPSFIKYRSDDCHAFQLQCVLMSDYQYRKLRTPVKADDKENELREFLIQIYDETTYNVNTLFFTDGCSDLVYIVRLYCEDNNMDFDDADDKEAARVALSDDEVFEQYLQQYIDNAYSS